MLRYLAGPTISAVRPQLLRIDMKKPQARTLKRAWSELKGEAMEKSIKMRKSTADTLKKCIAREKSINMGKPGEAAHGLQVLMGVSDVVVGNFLLEGEAAIEREVMLHGTASDRTTSSGL